MRVYETTDHPVAREMIGYLLVRGGVHILAYAKALTVATGVDVTKLLPIPKLDNRVFDEARKYEDQGVHRRLYTFSDRYYKEIVRIWQGTHPSDGQPLEVDEGAPQGGPIPDLPEVPEEFSPGISAEDFFEIAKRLQRSAGL